MIRPRAYMVTFGSQSCLNLLLKRSAKTHLFCTLHKYSRCVIVKKMLQKNTLNLKLKNIIVS